MVMDVVGRRDRAGIAEIETCDMEHFVQLVIGERAKWLWYGKPLKKGAARDALGVPETLDDGRPNATRQLSFKEGEHGGFTWTARKSVADGLNRKEQDDDAGIPDEQTAEDEDGIKGVLKRTSGFKEARSGLGKFKGAVGFGHKYTSSKDESPHTPNSPHSPRVPLSPVVSTPPPRQSHEHSRRPGMRRSISSPVSSNGQPQSPVQEHRQRSGAESIPEHKNREALPAYAASYQERHHADQSHESLKAPSFLTADQKNGDTMPADEAAEDATYASVAGSVYNEVNLDEELPSGPETEQDMARLMRRTVSYSRVIDVNLQTKSENAYPRHLSFSLAESSVLSWESIVSPPSAEAVFEDLAEELQHERFTADELKQLRHLIAELSTNTVAFTQAQLYSLTSLITKCDEDQETLESMYRPQLDRTHALRGGTETITRSEKERLEESAKEIETLAAKLDYEVSGLKGKVEDVAVGVEDFAKGVGRVEDRVRELEKDAARAEQKGWSCVMS